MLVILISKYPYIPFGIISMDIRYQYLPSLKKIKRSININNYRMIFLEYFVILDLYIPLSFCNLILFSVCS